MLLCCRAACAPATDGEVRDRDSPPQVVRKLNSEVEHNPGVGLIVCVLNDKFNEEFLYPAIKRWSHTQSGIATQCVRGDKCTTAKGTGRGNPAYIAGILLKMNLKLGGHNVYARDGLQLMRSKPTIVFGVDVNHASPSKPPARSESESLRIGIGIGCPPLPLPPLRSRIAASAEPRLPNAVAEHRLSSEPTEHRLSSGPARGPSDDVRLPSDGLRSPADRPRLDEALVRRARRDHGP